MTPQRSWIVRVYDAVFDFLIGDDWVLAVGTVVTLGIAALVSLVMASWWVIVLGVPLTLVYSLSRALQLKK